MTVTSNMTLTIHIDSMTTSRTLSPIQQAATGERDDLWVYSSLIAASGFVPIVKDRPF